MKVTRRRFKVGIRKEYFPRDIWPKEFGRSYVETFQVLATGRREAAELIWARHGERLMKLMTCGTLPGRRISLDVNSPGRVNSIGRLTPVLVHTEPMGEKICAGRYYRHFEDNQGLCHECGILLNPDREAL